MTNKTAHTPGPWRIAILGGAPRPAPDGASASERIVWDRLQAEQAQPFRENDGAWVITSESGRVGSAAMQAKAKRGQGYVTPDPEGEANARLIAAAPELLEALRAILTYSEGTADTSSRCVEVEDAARAAIAKATGDNSNAPHGRCSRCDAPLGRIEARDRSHVCKAEGSAE